MRSARIWGFTLFLAALAIGCGGSPTEPKAEAVIGVKIYETHRDLPELFAEWRELGVNAVFVARKLASRDEFHALAAKNGIDVFVILPVFFAPEGLEENPDLWAITADGGRAKEDWVEFACPNRQEFRAQRVNEAVEIARMCQPAGLSIDFIRYFSFWEMVAPDRDPATLPDTCYCPVCLRAFAGFAGVDQRSIPADPRLAAEWIAANVAERWVDFKCATITSLASEIAASVRAVDQGIRVNLHVVPWRSGDFDGAITRITGQDRAAFGGLADFLSPMCYSFMLHREPSWIASVVEDVSRVASCPVLPSIQVAAAYREGESFSSAEFEACLRAALQPPSAGVVFWSWDHIEADPAKASVIRRVVGGTG